MAVTRTEGGWTLTAADDVADFNFLGGATRNTSVSVDQVIITKAAAGGTITLKDGAGTLVLLTPSLADGSVTILNFRGAIMSGLEFDAVSAGTAVIKVMGKEVPSSIGV